MTKATLIKKAFNWGLISFRGLVQYHHGILVGCMVTCMQTWRYGGTVSSMSRPWLGILKPQNLHTVTVFPMKPHLLRLFKSSHSLITKHSNIWANRDQSHSYSAHHKVFIRLLGTSHSEHIWKLGAQLDMCTQLYTISSVCASLPLPPLPSCWGYCLSSHPIPHPASALTVCFSGKLHIFYSSVHTFASVFTPKALNCPFVHATQDWGLSQEHFVLLTFFVAVTKYPTRITLREEECIWWLTV